MAEAGLTPGGFYAHFESKEDLFGSAVAEALEQVRSWHQNWSEGHKGFARIRAFFTSYLSPAHCKAVSDGCPLPALLPEIARSSPGVFEPFNQQVTMWIDDMVESMSPSQPGDRDLASAWICFAAGALQLARAERSSRQAARILRTSRGQMELLIRTREQQRER